MDTRLKRFLSLALALIMVISMVPTNTVFATEGDDVVIENTDPTTEPAGESHVCDFVAGEVVAPTCEAAGYTPYACECGETEQRDVVDALGHAWGEVVVAEAATCEAAGSGTKTCGTCGATEPVVIDALGHAWGETEVAEAATCEAAGSGTKTCGTCGAEETVEIAALGHDYVDGTCGNCGAADPVAVVEVTYVAKVGNTEYATIDEAIAAWTNGTTLTLLDDVTLSDVIQLSSTEHHILDLGTYTMTAASKKDAIQIVNNGRTSASYALDIKADANNPGGITATGKAVVKTTGKSGVKDRPIIRFYNGVFTGTNVVYHSGSNGTNCPQFWFYGGEFNGTVFANRALFQFYGGTFNGSLQMSVDSSAYALIAGGRFKQLNNLYGSSLNTEKFTIGTSKGNFNVGVYVAEDGYIVVGGPVITELSEKYPAVASNVSKAGSYLPYSSAATYGLFYEDADMAIAKHGEANVTVWVKPYITIPENVEGDAAVVEEIKNNAALQGYTPENLPTGAELEVVLNSVGETIVYDVTPMANGTEFEPTEAITFRLPVPASVTKAFAKVYHDGELMGIYDVKGADNAKYVELSSADFSEFVVEPTNDAPAASINGVGYATIQAAVNAAAEGDTITILAGEHTEGTIKLPSVLKNVTIKGEAGAVLKDTSISAADGNSYSYIGLTFDGLTFDNGRLLFTGWRNGEETIENLTVTNCIFKNLYDTTNTAPVHINKDAAEAVNGFTFTNNKIDGATGGSKSGVYAQLTGNVVFTDNIINNVSFRPYVIQITTDDGVADEFIVTGNTFSGSAVGRAQGLGNNADGTDTVNLVVSENIFKGITDSQQICYWNFNPATTTADLSENYYDIDIKANPTKIYYNSAAQDVSDLIEMGLFPYYADEAMTEKVNSPAIKVTYPEGNPVYPDGKVEYYDDMLTAVPYTTNCPRLEGATITLLADVSAAGLRFMENDMVFDLNGHTYTITAGTGSQGTNTSGFQIRPEVTTDVIFKNGTIKVAEGAPVVWMFNNYATDFIVENVTVDCSNMAWSYGERCYVYVSRAGDNAQFIGTTKIENFNSAVAGYAFNVADTMTIGENVVLGGSVELEEGATLTAPEGLEVIAGEGLIVVYANGIYIAGAPVAKIGDVNYITLQAAINAAQNGDTVTVLSDIVLTEGVTVPADKTITLDLNGKTISQTKAQTTGYSMIVNDGNLTIMDSVGDGKISYTDSGNGGEYESNTIMNRGTLTLKSGTVENLSSSTVANNGYPYAIDTSIWGKATEVNTIIEGGKVYCASYSAMRLRGDSATEAVNVTVTGGEIVGTIEVQNSSNVATGKLTISGGKLSNSGTANVLFFFGSNGQTALKTEITGGEFTGNIKMSTGASIGTGFNSKFIAGGTFSTDVQDFVVAGFTADPVRENGKIVYKVKAIPVAELNRVEYTSLQAAINDAQDGDTVYLLSDVELSETVVIDKAIRLYGENNTLTSSAARAINVTGAAANGVVIKDLIINASGERAVNVIQNATNVTLDNVTATAGNYALNIATSAPGAVVTIKNSDLTGLSVVNVASAGAQVTINNTNLICNDTTDAETYGAITLGLDATDAEVTMTGGSVDAKDDSFGAAVFGIGGDVTFTNTDGDPKVYYVVALINGAGVYNLESAFAYAAEQNGTVTIEMIRDLEQTETATVPQGAKVILNMNGHTITGIDNSTASFSVITNRGELTVTGNGKITLEATNNRGWNAYSSVISNTVGGKLIVENGTIEHLGGTDMAYAIDNLTNGKGTYAETVINGGTIKSTYRGIRQFLNGTEAQNILTVNGGTIEGANKSIWMQDPSANANTGKLTVGEGATLNGDVYLFVTAGSTTWPVEVSIAASAVNDQVVTGNVPAGYEVINDNGTYGVKSGVAKIGNTYYDTIAKAIEAAQAGETVVLLKDVALDAPITVAKSITIDGNGNTITQSAACNNTYALLYFDGADVLNITVKNLTFDGIKGGAAIRTLGANMTIDNCVFQNCEHTQVQGLVRLTQGKAVVKNSKFLNNNCSMGISFNYDTDGLEGDTFLVDNCVFEDNTANATALVYYVKGAGATITNNEFVDNKVNCNTNGATIYLGFQENCVVTGNLFKNNDVVDVSNSTRVGGALFFGYEAEVSGNAFIGNTASNAAGDVLGQVCTSTYYGCEIDLSENYWGGDAPVYGADYTIQHQTGEANFALDSYYTKYNETTGVLSEKVDINYVAQVGKLGYTTLADAFAAAKAGDTITIFEGTYAMPSMKAGITVVGQGNVVLEGTLTGTLENLTLKNLHIKGSNAQRWAYAKGDLVFENVTFEATGAYALHFDGITEGATLLYKDCKIIGWAAMSGSPASCTFDGCTFEGNGTYGLIRTYFDATIKDCTFDVDNVNTTDKYQDGIHAVGGATVTVTGCTNANGEMIDVVNVGDTAVVVLDGEEIRNVAKIGDTYYRDLHDALTACAAGQTVELIADVDLAGQEWTPVGTSSAPFKGIFDGKGHTISNLVVNGGTGSNMGLFGFTTDGEIKNLTIENAQVSGRLNVGVVAGTPYTTKYTNIKVTGHVEVNGMAYVGGVGGKNAYADWTNVTVDVDDTSYVKANSVENGTAYRTYVGGVIGFNGEGGHTFKNISSNIKVIGSTCDIGGIFGIAHYNNKFENITFTGSVEAPADAEEVGAIAGVWHNELGTTVTFTNITSNGSVTIGDVTTAGNITGGAYNANNDAQGTTGTLTIDGDEKWPAAAKVGGNYYDTLQDAIDAAQAGQTITLLKNLTLDTGVIVPADKTVVLDLNGKTVSATMDTLPKSFALITNKGTLTVKDSATGGKLSVEYTGASFGYGKGLYTISNEGGTVNVESGIVENLTTVTGSMYDAIDNNSTLGDTVLNVTGGDISCGYIAIRQFANSTTYENIVNVSGNAVVNGGNCAIWTQNPGSTQPKANINITDGDVTGRILLGESTEFAAVITGGAFSDAGVEEFLAEGYSLNYAGGKYFVVPSGIVAKIGDKGYTTITAALNAAENNDVIEVLAGTYDEEVVWANEENKSVTLKGAGAGETILTGGMYLGVDNSQCDETTITVEGFTFRNKGILVASQENVIIKNNEFMNITDCVATSQSATANAISVIGKNINATVTGNKIVKTADSGIHLRNIATAKVENNVVINAANTSVYVLYDANIDTPESVVIKNNALTTWGTAGAGRAIRVNGSYDTTITGNVMLCAAAPEEFVKVTGITALDASANYWNGVSPETAGMFATDLSGYTAYDNLKNYYTDAAKTNHSLVEIAKVVYVAEVNGQGYETLQAAVYAAGVGDTVKLLANVAATDVAIARVPMYIAANGFNVSYRNFACLHYEVDGEFRQLTSVQTDADVEIKVATLTTDEAGPAVAYIDGDPDNTMPLQEALDAAEKAYNAQTGTKTNVVVKLTGDATVNSIVVIPTGVTLDIESKTLTVNSLIGLKDSYVTANTDTVKNDNKVEGGRLVVARNNLVLSNNGYKTSETNYILPVWDATQGNYVFSVVIVNTFTAERKLTVDKEADELYFRFKVQATNDILKGIMANNGGTGTGLSVIARIEWDTGVATEYHAFQFNDDMIKAATGSNDYYFKLTGYSTLGITDANMDSLTVYAMVETDSGAIAYGQNWGANGVK